MRLLMLVCVLAAGCSPEVVADSYYCGPEQLCPDEQACDRATNICVSDGQETAFACGDTTESEPNDSFATAEPVGDLECVARREGAGCVKSDSDARDYFVFTVPTSCSPRKVVAQAAYPVAFEPIVIELVDGADVVLATSEPCASGGEDDIGTTASCLEAPVGTGETFGLRIAGSGSENCGGSCAFNRYGLTIQLLAE